MKLIDAKSLINGCLYRLTPKQLREFYDEHVLGAVPKLRSRYGIVRDVAARQGLDVRNSTIWNKVMDEFSMVGTVLAELFGPDGELIDGAVVTNLVVNAGKDFVIDRLQSTTGTPALMDYMAIGTGTTAPAAGNTALETEQGTRVQGTLSQPTSTTDRLVSTFGSGNPSGAQAITEAGRLNASSSGTLLCRATFSAINKGTSDSLQVTYDLTVS